MALPANQHFSSRAELEATSPPKATKIKPSYAQIVAAKKRISLIHKDIQPPHAEAEDQISTFKSRIYRSAKSPGALLLDLTEIRSDYTDFQSLQIVLEQHPKIYGCQFLSDGPRRYLELYIRPMDDKNDIVNTGVIFKTKKIRVFPCRSVDGDYTITTISLTHLPFVHPEEIGKGLEQSLAPFGKIIDVGITTEPKLGIFMGSGYAVIGKDKNDNQYQDLDHTISWCESSDQIFHCTWNNLPTWCRYCHQTGHTKFECEKSKAEIICYTCQHLGHRSFEYPRKVPLNPSKKRRTPALTKQNDEDVAPQPAKENQPASSTEALKSKHAPKGKRVVLPRTKKNMKSTILEEYINSFDVSETDGSDDEGSDYEPSEVYDSDSDSAKEFDAEDVISAMELDAVKEDAITALADLLPVKMELKMSLMQKIYQLQQRATEESLSDTEQSNLTDLCRQLSQLEESLQKSFSSAF